MSDARAALAELVAADKDMDGGIVPTGEQWTRYCNAWDAARKVLAVPDAGPVADPLAAAAKRPADEQVPLGAEFAQVLHDNFADLLYAPPAEAAKEPFAPLPPMMCGPGHPCIRSDHSCEGLRVCLAHPGPSTPPAPATDAAIAALVETLDKRMPFIGSDAQRAAGWQAAAVIQSLTAQLAERDAELARVRKALADIERYIRMNRDEATGDARHPFDCDLSIVLNARAACNMDDE
jgi:hypothetical protein